MTRMVQVAMAGDVAEAEELQTILRSAGIDSELEVAVDREHLALETIELAGAGGSETAESDHEDGRVAPEAINQRWAFRRVANTAATGSSRRPPRRESLYQCGP